MTKYTTAISTRLSEENHKWIQGYFKSKSLSFTKGFNWLVEKEREQQKRKRKKRAPKT